MSLIKMNELSIDTGDVIITVYKQGELWKLEWSDGIANSWSETYEAMSLAVARMATLMFIGENLGQGDLMFRDTPTKFAELAFDFMDERVS